MARTVSQCTPARSVSSLWGQFGSDAPSRTAFYVTETRQHGHVTSGLYNRPGHVTGGRSRQVVQLMSCAFDHRAFVSCLVHVQKRIVLLIEQKKTAKYSECPLVGRVMSEARNVYNNRSPLNISDRRSFISLTIKSR